MSDQPSIHLHIEELVLHGLPSNDRHRIGEALQRELTSLLSEEQPPTSFAKSAEIDYLNGETFQTTGTVRPEATGAQVARAVFGALQ
jgi:hypothetical protein